MQEILSAPKIIDLLPIEFENGNTVGHFSVGCAACGGPIAEADMRGGIDVQVHTAHVTGHAICHGCKSISPINIRFRDDGTYLFATKEGWEEKNLTKNKEVVIDIDKLFARYAPPAIAALLVIVYLLRH